MSAITENFKIPQILVGSMPRPPYYLHAVAAHRARELTNDEFRSIADAATRSTIRRLIETGSEIISDGEITKPSFATYPVDGLSNVTGE